MTIDKKHLTSLKKSMHQYALIRRDVIKQGGDALHLSKRAIFALHRDDKKEAAKKLKEAEALFKKLHKAHKSRPEMKMEGSYKAAVEEFVEATLFYQFITTGDIGKVTAFDINGDVYLAGLCDVPGELYRYAIKAATKRDHNMVARCEEMSAELITALMQFEFTKYLRNKFDQAKSAHAKLEIVMYELSLREEK